jgi:AraC family transcriptional regulator
MQRSAQDRISVVRDHRLVPLVPGMPHAAPSPSPWQGIAVERHSVSTLEIPLHEHHSFCLHVQLSGAPTLEWWSDGQNRVERPQAGSLILLTPGTSDRLRWDGVSERLIVSIDKTFVDRAAEEGGAHATPVFHNNWLLQDSALRAVLTEMNREREAGWPAGSLYGDLLGLSLGQTLLRRQGGLVMHELRGGLPLPRLRRVLEFVEERLGDDLRLEQMAAEAGLSPFHFARQFRESTGVTPHQHVLEQRIARAKSLLKLRNLSMQQIAEDTGFGSATNLARSFRLREGVTPGAWLKTSR